VLADVETDPWPAHSKELVGEIAVALARFDGQRACGARADARPYVRAQDALTGMRRSSIRAGSR